MKSTYTTNSCTVFYSIPKYACGFRYTIEIEIDIEAFIISPKYAKSNTSHHPKNTSSHLL